MIYGFCSFNGTAEQDLSLTLLGVDSEGNTIEEIPGRERTRLIWRRLLNNLPYIYKTKGTEESIRAVLAAYGIPDHLLLVKEYAGIQASDEPSEGAQFIFDDVNYEYKKEIDEVLPKFRQDIVTGEELTTREEMKVGRKDGSAIK